MPARTPAEAGLEPLGRNAVHTGTLCVDTPDRPAPWSFEPGL